MSAGVPRRSRRPGRTALIAGASAVVVAIAVVAFAVTRGGAPATGFVPTGNSPTEDAQQITTAFLTAWEGGDLSKAARYTDRPSAAQAALSAYRKYLNLRKLTGTVQGTAAAPASAGVSAATTREQVTFGVSAGVASGTTATALRGTWNYQSSLVAYQKPKSDVWYIAWAPDVLAPNLTASTHLAAVRVAPQVVSVDDANGNPLSTYKDAGLTTIANLLEQKAPAGQGSPGLFVQIENSQGKAVPNSQAVITAPNNIANLATTINATAEKAARTAVSMHKDSAMVAIQPSTGDILAIANNAGFNDFALTAAVAPGSTMKIVTSTALFTLGLATANTPVACPPAFTVQGITYHNDQGESEPASTPLTYDFAQSCNNAFDQWWPHLSGQLAAAAKKYYGLDQNWNIGLDGLSAKYFNAPASASGSELAQEAFGEGQITASPLAMASIAATVCQGSFKQPILVPGTPQVAATPLPASTDAQLKQMMRAVVTEGTAAGIGLGPDVYAKTGTADIAGQEQPNSWFVAFDPSKDIAVAALDVNAGYGAQFAAPEVASFLNAY